MFLCAATQDRPALGPRLAGGDGEEDRPEDGADNDHHVAITAGAKRSDDRLGDQGRANERAGKGRDQGTAARGFA